jgi:hypothetical protein
MMLRISLSLASYLPEEGKMKALALGSGAMRRDRLEAKNGLSDGLGVDVTLSVSISGPESLRSSNSSIRSLRKKQKTNKRESYSI